MRQRLKDGDIPGRKHGARWLIRVLDLDYRSYIPGFAFEAGDYGRSYGSATMFEVKLNRNQHEHHCRQVSPQRCSASANSRCAQWRGPTLGRSSFDSAEPFGSSYSRLSCSKSISNGVLRVCSPDRRINRYYDPATGQFVSVDPMVGSTGMPFAYANDNPVSMSDTMGNDATSCDNFPVLKNFCFTLIGHQHLVEGFDMWAFIGGYWGKNATATLYVRAAVFIGKKRSNDAPTRLGSIYFRTGPVQKKPMPSCTDAGYSMACDRVYFHHKFKHVDTNFKGGTQFCGEYQYLDPKSKLPIGAATTWDCNEVEN